MPNYLRTKEVYDIEEETGIWVGPKPRKVTIVQSQQCDRVYRKSNNTITINIDYSPEEMTTRLKAMFSSVAQTKKN